MKTTTLAAIALIAGLSWLYLFSGAGMPKMDMGGGKAMLMPPPSWNVHYATLMFAMWTIMMIAMMLPSAAPVIIRVADRYNEIAPAAFFTLGYLIVWTGFSAVATCAQYLFDSAHLLSDAMAIRNGAAAAVIVFGAGLYQVSSVKRNCLARCCASINSLTVEPKRRSLAAVPTGIRYGISCLGCCWPLICLLFVVGVMNIVWIAAIAIWVLAEKTLPWGVSIARVGAVGLVGWGSVALAMALR